MVEPTARKYMKNSGLGLEIHEVGAIMKQPEENRTVILQKKEEEPKKDIRVIVREINNAERNNNSPPVPTGKYSVIYEDPPWE